MTLWSARKNPHIQEVTPRTVAPGTTVTISGRDFSNEGRLEIDGVPIASEEVTRWEDEKIEFSFSERSRSGLLQVQTADGASNRIFVTNTRDLPRKREEPLLLIDDVQPSRAAPGTVVRIVGSGFGPPGGLATLVFYRDETVYTLHGGDRWTNGWTDETVEIVLPPDVVPGQYRISVNGVETAGNLVVHASNGVPVYGDLQRYTLHQELSVSGITEGARAIFPLPIDLPEQDGARMLRETTPAVNGAGKEWAVYAFSPLPDVGTSPAEDPDSTGEPVLLDRIVRVDLTGRRSIRWEFQEDVDSRLLLDPVFREAFADLLQPITLSTAVNERIAALRERNINLANDAVMIAREVYQTVLDELETPVVDGSGEVTDDLLEALDGVPAEPFLYADLGAALGRRSGLPTRRHYGLLLRDDGTTVPHRWVEFFIPTVGWVPADPAMGDGVYHDITLGLEDFYGGARENTAFGNIDDRRITLVVDGKRLPRIFPGAEILKPTKPYAPGKLQIEFPLREVPVGVGSRWEVPILSPQFN